MLVVVGAETLVLALLVVLVAGLLRSHARILQALHSLGVDLDPANGEQPPSGSTTPVALRLPKLSVNRPTCRSSSPARHGTTTPSPAPPTSSTCTAPRRPSPAKDRPRRGLTSCRSSRTHWPMHPTTVAAGATPRPALTPTAKPAPTGPF